MAKQTINIGTKINSGGGDPLRTAFTKTNENFTELYTRITTAEGQLGISNLGGATIEQSIIGSVIGADSTVILDHTTGTITGKVVGDVTGSVVADDSTVLIDGVAGTINAGALTGALPAIDGSALTGISVSSIAFSNITSKPTTLAGYGITDAATLSNMAPTGAVDFTGATTIDFNTVTINNLEFADISAKPTTLAGYGITDAMTAGGNVEGNLKGSVFADDSTVLVDGVAGTINGSALTSPLTANLTINSPIVTGIPDFTGCTIVDIKNTAVDFTGSTITGTGFLSSAEIDTKISTATSSIVIPSGSSQSIDVVAADSTVLVDSVNGTLNATTLTGALPAINGSALTNVTTTFANITSTPTTLAGYGITDAASLAAPAFTGAVDFTGTTSVDFTGATVNGLTLTETDPIVGAITGLVKADGAGNISAAVAGTDYSTFDGAFGSLTGKPTTLAGYGITDAAGTSSATTFTADVKFDQGVTESFATYNNVSGVVNMDCDHGHLFYVTNATGDITTNFTNFGLTAEYGTNLTVIINQGATPYEVTAVQIGGAAQTINWQGGSAPTGNANGIDSFSFTILNDGGTYVVLGQMVDFT